MWRFKLEQSGKKAEGNGNEQEIVVAILDAGGVFTAEIEQEKLLRKCEGGDERE